MRQGAPTSFMTGNQKVSFDEVSIFGPVYSLSVNEITDQKCVPSLPLIGSSNCVKSTVGTSPTSKAIAAGLLAPQCQLCLNAKR